MFTGSARWDEIAAVVQALDIPVIGNGDVRNEHDVLRMWKHTQCAGIMIARGAFGQPWVFDRARALMQGIPLPPLPTVEERFRVALEHARLAQSYEPDRRGAALEFRKHLGWYVRGLPASADLRRRLHAIESLGQIGPIFEEYMAQLVPDQSAPLALPA
jgi:tRNA-dihydrouridine synthase